MGARAMLGRIALLPVRTGERGWPSEQRNLVLDKGGEVLRKCVKTLGNLRSGVMTATLTALPMVRLARQIARWTGSSTELCKFFHS